VDKDVEDGIVQPGLYLILEIKFSCARRSCTLHESAESFTRQIHRGLERFKGHYTKYLGESFALATSSFVPNDPAGNLSCLIDAVDLALQNIRDRDEEDEKDEKKDPLPGVQGACLFQTTAYHNANI
jgi:hypothetical protein